MRFPTHASRFRRNLIVGGIRQTQRALHTRPDFINFGARSFLIHRLETPKFCHLLNHSKSAIRPRHVTIMDSATQLSGPSAGSWALAGAILGATAAWFAMSGSYLSSKGKNKKKQATSWPNSYDVKIHPDSSDEELMERLGRERGSAAVDSEDEEDSDLSDGGAASTELSTFASHANEECKLVLVVRTDLGMGKGKVAAQCSHATLACYKHLLTHGGPSHPVLKRWERLGQAKIAVQCPGGEEQLLTLQAQAISLGLTARVIHDAGRTQIASGTATVLGVGPGPKSVVDQVTGGLKLL